MCRLRIIVIDHVAASKNGLALRAGCITLAGMHESSPKFPELPMSKFRDLCALASEYHQLAPWNHLSDSDMLAIVDPVTAKIRLVSVMGNAGHVEAC